MFPSILPALGTLGSLGLSGGPAGPSGAQSDNVFNSSGWTVATGRASASGGLNPWIVGGAVFAAALVALVWLKRK